MSARRGFLIALSFACLAAAAIWFAANFERRTQSEWVDFQGKARHERWLVAQRLLQRMGAKAQTVRSLPELGGLPRDATLLLPRGRQSLTPQSRESLLNWVRQGGRLVVEAEPPYLPDPLLDQLGVRRKMVAVTEDRKGSGELDAVSNASIGLHDHAEFLWRMVQGDHGTPDVFFFSDPRKLSLLEWLRTNAWSAVAGSALLVLVWLWHTAPRFGPLAPDPERARRRLLDHLRASGRFLWAHGGAQLLVDAARESCLRRVARVHPDLIGAAGTEHEAARAARLAELLGLDAEQSRMLFSHKARARAIDFLHTIRLYQTVHERLALKRRATQPTREGR